MRYLIIGSSNSLAAEKNSVMYDTSKVAVLMMVKSMAVSLASKNIRVNGIGPGWFETEMTKAYFESPKIRTEMENIIPMKRFTSLRDLGLLAVYLASPASNWMTGQVLYLDGGETASFL